MRQCLSDSEYMSNIYLDICKKNPIFIPSIKISQSLKAGFVLCKPLVQFQLFKILLVWQIIAYDDHTCQIWYFNFVSV